MAMVVLRKILAFLYNKKEGFFWIASLLMLGTSNPKQEHFSLCLAHHFDWTCWGCGIGHGIAYGLQGNFIQAWHSHWMALPAIVILLHRIYIIFSFSL